MTTPTETAHSLVHLLSTRGEGDYIGEQISQLAHSLQCAELATHDGADDETVLAALLHDIGHFLPFEQVRGIVGEVRDMASLESGDGSSVGRVGHETIGAVYLRQLGFSAKVSALVESHVAAKRYLCATDAGYQDALSEASKKSLVFQGGRMSAAEVAAWEASPWSGEMCRLRRWDDGAKVVGKDVLGVDGYEGMIVRHLEGRMV